MAAGTPGEALQEAGVVSNRENQGYQLPIVMFSSPSLRACKRANHEQNSRLVAYSLAEAVATFYTLPAAHGG